MEFSDTTNDDGIIQACEHITGLGEAGISGDATLLKHFTNRINKWNRIVWSWIFEADGNWQYEDSNQTDFPIATTTLTSGQQDYSIPSDALTIHRVEIKKSDGNWVRLKPIYKEDVGVALDEFQETDGNPIYFEVIGNSIKLYPTPSYTQAASLKTYFDRGTSTFVSTDTTKTPGFNAEFHDVIALGPSMDWISQNRREDRGTVNDLKEQIYANDWGYKDRIKKFYLRRAQRVRPTRLTPGGDLYNEFR